MRRESEWKKTVECKWMEFEMWWIKLAREKSCTGFSVVRNMTIIMRLLCPRVFSFPFLAAFFYCLHVCLLFFLFSLSIFALIFPVFVYSRSYAFAIRWSESDFCFCSFSFALSFDNCATLRALPFSWASEWANAFHVHVFCNSFPFETVERKSFETITFWKLNEG